MLKYIIGGLFLFFVFCIALRLCTVIIPLDEVGVRSNQLGAGVEEKDLGPGLWLVIPGIHKMDIMDPTIQRLNFADKVEDFTKKKSNYRQLSWKEASVKYGQTEGGLKLRTKDEYETSLDITVFYRIKKGAAYKVLLDMGPGYEFRKRFREQAVAIIWKVMANMSTEDFYDSEARTIASKLTTEKLNEALVKEKMPLETVSLLIRRVVFDKRFESKLITKQLFDQDKLLSESKEKLANERKKTELIVRETQAKVLAVETEMKQEIVTLSAKNEADIAQIKADAGLKVRTLSATADRSKREKIAEGLRLKEIAKAVGEKALNTAYQTAGGNLLLSRQMIDNLEVGDLMINTNQINPFDVRQFLHMVGADAAK